MTPASPPRLPPALGFGCYRLKGTACYGAVLSALRNGYRHIDTAVVYWNEEEVGKAVIDSGIPREEIYITTKLAPADHGYDKARASALASIARLQVEYVDLLLIHWPGTAGLGVKDPVQRENRMSTWAAMQDLYDGGLARAIGVSNYTTVHVEQLLSSPECRVKPAVNQVELHPLYQQRALRAFCSSHSIAVVPYSSLGEGSSELLGNEVVVRIASELTHADDGAVVTAAQVLLKWSLQSGLCAVIPKSGNEGRIVENSKLFDFSLTDEHMLAIGALDCGRKFCWDPEVVV